MIVLLVLTSILLGAVLWSIDSRGRLRYLAIAVAWLLTVATVLWRSSASGQSDQILALLSVYTFPFFWILILTRAPALSRRPWLFVLLVPPIFLASFWLGIVTLVSRGILVP